MFFLEEMLVVVLLRLAQKISINYSSPLQMEKRCQKNLHSLSVFTVFGLGLDGKEKKMKTKSKSIASTIITVLHFPFVNDGLLFFWLFNQFFKQCLFNSSEIHCRPYAQMVERPAININLAVRLAMVGRTQPFCLNFHNKWSPCILRHIVGSHCPAVQHWSIHKSCDREFLLATITICFSLQHTQ